MVFFWMLCYIPVSLSQIIDNNSLLGKISLVCGSGAASDDVASWSKPIEQFLSNSDSFDINIIGELDHYDGTTLLFKAALIDAFINRYPNTILLIERGIAEINVIDNRLRTGQDSIVVPFAIDVTPNSHISIRGGKEALARVLESKYETPDTSFILGGMDTEYTSIYFKLFMDSLIVQLKASADKRCSGAVSAAYKVRKNHIYTSLPSPKEAKKYYRKLDYRLHYEAVQRILECPCLSSMQRQALKSDELHHIEVKQWLSKSRKHPFNGSFISIIRDSLMAENVAWYHRQYPNHKILISVSNFHAAKTFSGIHRKFNEAFRPMTWYLDKMFPKEVYTVPIIRYTGALGRWKYKDQYYKEVIKKPEYSLEYFLSKKCKTVAYVDFSKLDKTDKFWMHGTFSDGYKYAWKKSFDSVIFIHTMKTDTQRGITIKTPTTSY